MTAGFDLGRGRTPLVAAVLLVGALLRAAAVANHDAVDLDEGRYLDNAVNLLEGRGFTTHDATPDFRSPAPRGPARPCVHPEGTNAPLYPMLLAATFRMTGAGLAAAQAWSLLAGCLAILLTFLLARRLFDEATGLLAALLVAVHPDLVVQSSWATTEPHFTAGLLGILLLAAREPSLRARLPHAAALGVACGTLSLLSASGAAAAAAVGIALLATSARHARATAAALFAACFLLAVSPWLVRNQRVFGDPTHGALRPVAGIETELDLFTRGPLAPGIEALREEHGSLGLARSLAQRLRSVGLGLVAGDRAGHLPLGLIYPVAAIATWRLARTLPGHLVVALSASMLLAAPARAHALERSLLPLRPWIYLCVIGAALHLIPSARWMRARWGAGAGRPAAAAVATVVAILAWSCLGPIRTALGADEGSRDEEAREAAAWIAAHTPPEAVLMEGGWLHPYAFLFERCVVRSPAVPPAALHETAAEQGADYLVVSERLLRARPGLRGLFRIGAEGAVESAGPPAGFEEAWAGAGRRVVVWRIPGAE